MIVWWGSAVAEAVTEPLMAVGQAAIGGKTEIREVLVDFSVTAAKAAIEKTGKIETIIEAVRAGQVRSGLNGMAGLVAVAVPEAQHKDGAMTMRTGGLIFIMIMIAEQLELAASMPSVLQSEMPLRLVQT